MTIIGALMEGIGIALIIPVINYNEISKPAEGILSTLIYNFVNVLGLEHSLVGILYLIVFTFIFIPSFITYFNGIPNMSKSS